MKSFLNCDLREEKEDCETKVERGSLNSLTIAGHAIILIACILTTFG